MIKTFITKLLSGLKLLAYILAYSSIIGISLIIPFIFYSQSGNWWYLLTYVAHMFVTAYMLGKE